MDIRESKSMLAKLLATENIKVEHGNYETYLAYPSDNSVNIFRNFFIFDKKFTTATARK